MENGQIPEPLVPIIGGIAPAFLLRLSAKLDITIDDQMKQKIAENELIGAFMMDAKSLIDSTSGQSFESDAELISFVEN